MILVVVRMLIVKYCCGRHQSSDHARSLGAPLWPIRAGLGAGNKTTSSFDILLVSDSAYRTIHWWKSWSIDWSDWWLMIMVVWPGAPGALWRDLQCTCPVHVTRARVPRLENTDYLTHPLSFELFEVKANHLLMPINTSIKPWSHLNPSFSP